MTSEREPHPRHMRGRVALVTGGVRGIGAAVCHALAEDGVDVAAGSYQQPEQAQKFLDSMTADFPGRRISVHEGNIGVAEDCRRVVRDVIERHGALDILVNNAGITIDRNVAKMTDEDWQKVIAVNLSGAFFMAQAALEHMQANYAASKSGLFGLTKSLAREAAFQLERSGRPPSDGIGLTVNAVTPGFIGTEMLLTIPDKVLQRVMSQIPVRRLGRPEEVARVVCFLAADESAYITGQIWAVNGGLDM